MLPIVQFTVHLDGITMSFCFFFLNKICANSSSCCNKLNQMYWSFQKHRLIILDLWSSKIHNLVQFNSVTQSCPALCNTMDCSMSHLPIKHQLLDFTHTHVYQVSDVIQPSHPLLSPSPPPSLFFSIKVFSSESFLCIRWPKYWSFSFSISPSNEYSGLIFFRMDWLDLLAVQGALKSLLQYHSSKASILWHSAFFIIQLSHPYITTGKP